MLSEGLDAASAAFQSPSEFSREYRRLFGQPPQRASVLDHSVAWLAIRAETLRETGPSIARCGHSSHRPEKEPTLPDGQHRPFTLMMQLPEEPR